MLLGTQMIAKGLDVANVRLVGVVSGDTSLNFPDFRAAERTFQLIAQVAGRAGRGEHLGRVIVQTFNPDDPTIRLAAKHDYLGFATRELALRAEVGLPPIGRMARIVLRDTDHLANTQRAHTLARQLAEANARLDLHVRLRGPAPCPIARIADHHRLQIELISPPPHGAAALQQLLTDCRNRHHLTSDTHPPSTSTRVAVVRPAPPRQPGDASTRCNRMTMRVPRLSLLPKYSGSDRRSVRRLTWSYAVGLSLIALLTLTAHHQIGRALEDQRADGLIINVAGKQRMLSQKISKAALAFKRRGGGRPEAARL